jgi:hypothetical protein
MENGEFKIQNSPLLRVEGNGGFFRSLIQSFVPIAPPRAL